MAYHDDLLAQAVELLDKDEEIATPADLRRAVSTAYYALFHLLISETTLNWSRDSSRPALGLMFDHGLMRKASERLLNSRLFPFSGSEPSVVRRLRSVAELFVQLQTKRHIADYDNGVTWTHTESLQEVKAVREAFETWAAIRYEDIAQEYLVSLLIKPRD